MIIDFAVNGLQARDRNGMMHKLHPRERMFHKAEIYQLGENKKNTPLWKLFKTSTAGPDRMSRVSKIVFNKIRALFLKGYFVESILLEQDQWPQKFSLGLKKVKLINWLISLFSRGFNCYSNWSLSIPRSHPESFSQIHQA